MSATVCLLRSGSGFAHQPGGVQCQEQVLPYGDGDGRGPGSLRLHRPAQPSAPGHRQHGPAERHRCSCTGTNSGVDGKTQRRVRLKCPYFRNKLSKCSVFVNPVIFFKVFVCIKTFCSSERSECGSAALSVTSVGLFHQKRGNFPPRIGSKIILDAFKFFLTYRPSFRFISVLSVDPSQFGRRK